MANRIVETVKKSGEISDYVLSNGETISKEVGVERAKNGEIEGVIIAHSRTKPDGEEGNNLSSMNKE